MANNLKNPVIREKYNNLVLKMMILISFFHLNSITSPEKEKIYLNVPLAAVDARIRFSKLSLIMKNLQRLMTVKYLDIFIYLYLNDF